MNGIDRTLDWLVHRHLVDVRQLEGRARGLEPVIVDLTEGNSNNMQVRAMWYRRQLQNDEHQYYTEIEKDKDYTK